MDATAAQRNSKKRRSQIAPLTEETMKARRDKNRESQHAFRQRRQAAEHALERRIQRLEQVIEEVSNEFSGLCEEVLQIEVIAREHPGLVRKLRSSLIRVLALAKDMDDNNDGDGSVASAATGAPSNEDWGNTMNYIVPGDTSRLPGPRPDRDINKVLLAGNTNVSESLVPATPSAREGTDSLFDELTMNSDFVPTELPLLTSPNHSSKVHGNGRIASATPSTFVHPPLVPSSEQELDVLQALGSFPLRLLKVTLSHGYFALLNERAEDVARAFGSTLLFWTREDIMARLQFLLWTGSNYLYEATGITWGGSGGTKAVSPYCTLPSPSSLSGPGSKVEEYIHMKEQPEFVTVIGVLDYLQGLGAEVIDADTIEIEASGLGLSNSQIDPDTGLPIYTLPQAPWIYFPSLPDNQPEQGRSKMRLNVSQFISKLARIGVCSSGGPTYPRYELEQVIRSYGTFFVEFEGWQYRVS